MISEYGYLSFLCVLGREVGLEGPVHGVEVGNDLVLHGIGCRPDQADAQLTHPGKSRRFFFHILDLFRNTMIGLLSAPA